MEDSIILLSSMSPKLPKSKKTHSHNKHSLTKLALKKNLRRSSMYDKRAEISDMIVIGSESESNSSSNSKEPKISYTSPIIISDSESNSDGFNAAAANFKMQYKTKTADIERWVNNVNLERCNRNSTLDYSGGSCVFEKRVKQNLSDILDKKSEFIKNTTGMRNNIENSDDFSLNKFNIMSGQNETKDEVENDNFENKMLSHSQNEANDKALSKNVSSDCSDVEDEASGILDELYGNSWRANKLNVLPYSEPRKKKQSILSTPTAKTERKSLVYKNPYLDVERAKSASLIKSLQKSRVEAALLSPFMGNLKNICESDSSDSTQETDRKITRKKLLFDEASDKENTISDLDEDDLEVRIRRKQNKNKESSNQANQTGGCNLDKEDFTKTELLESPMNLHKIPVMEVKATKKLHKKKKKTNGPIISEKTLDGHCKKSEKKSSKNDPGQQLCNSSNSSEDDMEEHWWKPSRKSVLKLYKERETTKMFSFLASLSKHIPAHQSVPSAVIYRSDFKKHRDDLVQKLFKLYNDTIFENNIPEDTSITWNARMRKTAGYCYCKRAVKNEVVIKRSVRIVLSTKVVDSAEKLRDTLLHEMCHAATWMVDKIHNGHGPHWRAWANKAMLTYPELPPIRRCHDYDISTKYTYRCVNCGYSIGRHTKSLDIERKRCGHCYGKFEVLLNKQTKEGKAIAVPSTPKKVTGFALFVKEHYAKTKAPNLSHGEVMKLLGQKFSEMKVAQTND